VALAQSFNQIVGRPHTILQGKNSGTFGEHLVEHWSNL
jgi:hypothetical protein